MPESQLSTLRFPPLTVLLGRHLVMLPNTLESGLISFLNQKVSGDVLRRFLHLWLFGGEVWHL